MFLQTQMQEFGRFSGIPGWKMCKEASTEMQALRSRGGIAFLYDGGWWCLCSSDKAWQMYFSRYEKPPQWACFISIITDQPRFWGDGLMVCILNFHQFSTMPLLVSWLLWERQATNAFGRKASLCSTKWPKRISRTPNLWQICSLQSSKLFSDGQSITLWIVFCWQKMFKGAPA